MYNYTVLISQCGSRRAMRFNSLLSGAQAQIDLNERHRPCLEYVQLMIVSLVFYADQLDDKSVLVIGLGGGTLATAIRRLNQTCRITVVERDPLVEQMAQKYFFFQQDANMSVTISDGRKFLENLPSSVVYDVILFDAYDPSISLPNHMKTEEFFATLKSRLNGTRALLVLNLVPIYESYFGVRRTIDSLFRPTDLITFRSSDLCNVILVARIAPTCDVPSVNHESTIVRDIQEKLHVDVYSLLNRKQNSTGEQRSSATIYKDNSIGSQSRRETAMSLSQFVDVV